MKTIKKSTGQQHERIGRVEERLGRWEERATRMEERLSNIERDLHEVRQYINNMVPALQVLLESTLGASADKSIIGFKPSGNPMSAEEAERYRGYFFRIRAGQRLSEHEAREFYRLAQEARRERPDDIGLAVVAGLAGFALGMLIGAAIFASTRSE
jgi:hypothetical protein